MCDITQSKVIVVSNSASKLVIECEENEDEKHPHCPHGPTLFFYQAAEGRKSGYFACAAHRDKRNCVFHLSADEVTTKHLNRRYETLSLEYKALRCKVHQQLCKNNEPLHYCLVCNVPLLNVDVAFHSGHEIAQNLLTQQLQDPTQFLRPLDNDKVQAQYFFDRKALAFFAKCFNDLGITKVICMGAPRLHSYIRAHCMNVQSFLLDFDHRFYYFFDDEHFAWHNMCNNHFFDEAQHIHFCKFLKCKDSDRLLLFTDPPFGCRTEPISHTLHQLTRLHNAINQLPHQPLPIFWIFPYFSEHYIQQQMPEMQMCDYKVNYTNHAAYTDSGEKCRKQGSPVRLFTNVPLERLHLPVLELYKYCAHCGHYTALENRHCLQCDTCPAKNGDTYRHCRRCGTCVKPSYVHCVMCRRCTQVEGHNCSEYQARQRCWICLQVGHTERQCETWLSCCKKIFLPARESGKAEDIICLLCGRQGHNELRCKQRGRYIEETIFLGEKQLRFKI